MSTDERWAFENKFGQDHKMTSETTCICGCDAEDPCLKMGCVHCELGEGLGGQK